VPVLLLWMRPQYLLRLLAPRLLLLLMWRGLLRPQS
jgi:hypothetical protein